MKKGFDVATLLESCHLKGPFGLLASPLLLVKFPMLGDVWIERTKPVNDSGFRKPWFRKKGLHCQQLDEMNGRG